MCSLRLIKNRIHPRGILPVSRSNVFALGLMIGDAAKAAWIADSDRQPEEPQKNIIRDMDDDTKSTLLGGGFVGSLLLLLLL